MTWTDPCDDVPMTNATNELATWAREEARQRGILDPFVYLNYANGEQSVYEGSLAPEDMKRLRDVQKKYDPEGVFAKLWKGGFKLGGR
jgi:hypothetical protein